MNSFNSIPVSIPMIIYVLIYTIQDSFFLFSIIIPTSRLGVFPWGADDVTIHKFGLVHTTECTQCNYGEPTINFTRFSCNHVLVLSHCPIVTLEFSAKSELKIAKSCFCETSHELISTNIIKVSLVFRSLGKKNNQTNNVPGRI